nr:MAG TPA: hypothetical protein [Bacteriophage sp.]
MCVAYRPHITPCICSFKTTYGINRHIYMWRTDHTTL